MEEVIKDLGLKAIWAAIILNGGAFALVLAHINSPIKVRRVLSMYLAGLFFAIIAYAVTYTTAQLQFFDPEKYSISFKSHLLLMITPAAMSFLSFFSASIIAIISYEPANDQSVGNQKMNTAKTGKIVRFSKKRPTKRFNCHSKH